MSKQKLFLDVDSTIINSIKAYCSVYNYLYKYHKNFVPAKWWEVKQWNLKDQAPLVENVDEIFSHELFFVYTEFLNDNTKEIIEQLCEKYNVIIVTIGTLKNIALKSMWLKENLPCIKEHIFLCNEGCQMDKSIIQMQGGIFIDDVASNLDSSNADLKICIGDTYDWNKNFDGLRCINWTAVQNMLL